MRGKFLEGRPCPSPDHLWHECQRRSFCFLFSPPPSIVLGPSQFSMFWQNSQTVCITQALHLVQNTKTYYPHIIVPQKSTLRSINNQHRMIDDTGLV